MFYLATSEAILQRHLQCDMYITVYVISGSVGGSLIVETGLGVLLETMASSSIGTVGYSLDHGAHAMTPSYCIVRM